VSDEPSPHARKRRFPKRVWLVNHESYRGDAAEVVRSEASAEAYRSMRGWTVVEYVRASQSKPVAEKP
jgi:hypothetical protein